MLKSRHRVIKALFLLAAPFLAWFLVHTACVITVGLRDTARHADVAVVLGARVYEGGVPSPRLMRRLARAAEVYRQGLVPHVIVSGGTGASGYDEAAVMRDTLVGLGVPGSAIVVDSHGSNTRATALNAKRIMAERGWSSALIVTSYAHILRTRLAFSQAGIAPVHTAHARLGPEWRDPYSLIREFFAYYVYLVRPAQNYSGTT